MKIFRPVRYLVIVSLVGACAPSPPVVSPLAPPHSHELHLPPVGPTVRVAMDGKTIEVPLASLPHEGSTVPLLSLWRVAFPTADATTLHFDLTGSDGFHPASRGPCAARLLTGLEVGAAHMDVVTHDISFDDAIQLPGCYHVKAVVQLDAVR